MDVAIIKPKKHPFAHGAWRYLVTGRPLWGKGDNATFLRDATVDHRGGPRERLTRARWRRLARRHAALTVPAGLLAWDWRAVAAYALVLAGAGATVGAVMLARWWPRRSIRAEFVVPTWTVVAKVLGMPARRREAIRAVILPAGFGLEDETGEAPPLSVRIHLPMVPLDEGQRKRIATAAGTRLGIPDPTADWTVRGARAFVDLSPRSLAPAKLTFADVRALWLEADTSRPLVGLGPRRVPVYADLDNDGPHMGVSGGTGTGKSTLLRTVLAKRVRDGAGLVVADYKVTSHPWARRIARDDPHRVLYVCDEEPISEAILEVQTEFERRRELLKVDPSALEGFRTIDLLIEELNSLASRLRTWWGHERRRIQAEAKAAGEDVPYLPTVPPCVEAIAVLVQMGRELRIHVHLAAQRLDASAVSPRDGGAVRESITNRFLAKYTRQTWKMLCDGVPFEAFPGGPRGIWTAVVNGEVTHFRVPLLSNDEAYRLAMEGLPPLGPVCGGARWVDHGSKPALITLGAAWGLIPGCPSLDALRKAVQRADLEHAGRKGNALEYDMRDLLAIYSSTPNRVLESL